MSTFKTQVVRVTSDADGLGDEWTIVVARLPGTEFARLPSVDDLPIDVSRALADWLAADITHTPVTRIPRDPNYPMEQP